MRVAIITSVPEVSIGYRAIAEALGHEVACTIFPRVTVRDVALNMETPGDVVFLETRDALAPLFRAYDVDAVLCTGFPWLVPQEAIEVPPLGIVNGHPTMLPKGRGPYPWAWAVRNGDTEIGFTYHYMDASFDTGNVLAQKPIPFDPDESEETLIPKLQEVVGELLPQVFAKLEAGDLGTPQGDGEYQPRFEPEYATIDTTRTTAEVQRQVRAWSFIPERFRVGPVLGDRRVVSASTTATEGAERIECADGPLWLSF